MSNQISRQIKKKKIINLSSAVSAQRVFKVNLLADVYAFLFFAGVSFFRCFGCTVNEPYEHNLGFTTGRL